MSRMARAIERAIEAKTIKEKDRAARWVAAWGMLCGIHTNSIKLKRSEVVHASLDRNVDYEYTSLDEPEIVFSPTSQPSTSDPFTSTETLLSAGAEDNCVAMGIFDRSVQR
jgi:hypothetical protein